MRKAYLSGYMVVVLLGATPTASAQDFVPQDAADAREQDGAPRADIAPTIRFTLPFQSFTLVNGSQRTESVILGVAGAALFDGTWATESGLGVGGGGDFGRRFAFLRFGVTPTLVDSPDPEGGWTINAGPWLGFEAQWRSRREADRDLSERVQAVTHAWSVEAVRWTPGGSGISVMLRAGLVLPVARSEDANWSEYVRDSDDFHSGVDIGGSVGWAL